MTPTRCAYCHGDDPGQLRCPGCGSRLHPECYAELRACPSLGCRGLDRPRRRCRQADRPLGPAAELALRVGAWLFG